jgi:amidase
MSARHHLARTHSATTFDRALPPALAVEPGDIVTFETDDSAYERYANGESAKKIGPFNRVTGPVFVRGAEPGDALRIDILDVRIRRAWSVWSPGFGPLGGRTAEVQVRQLALEKGHVRISKSLKVPLAPMIGCIGLAPARGVSSSLEPAYAWGGNMDLPEVSAGNTLWLPVQVEGALLSLGDLHAAMGAGEPTWVGLEAAGEATVRIGVDKAMRLAGPRLRVGEDTLFVVALAGNRSLWEAKERATQLAYDFLILERNLEPAEAFAYCCARVGLRFGGPASPIVLAVVPDV